jgi:predicted acylesterase/phospholipase RssA
LCTRDTADKIIAVDIWPTINTEDIWRDPLNAIIGKDFLFNWFNRSSTEPTILSSLWRSFQIMATTLHNDRLAKHPAHILLQPDVHDYGSLDFSDIEGPVQAGRRCAEAYRNQILQLANS